jgi:hypothetical protein
MITWFVDPASERRTVNTRSHQPRSRRYGRNQTETDFLCRHCKHFVSTVLFVSGVHNRNHCPYCLWSRHLDLYVPGDRLSACKSLMKPIGLTIKATWKRYGHRQGELMLIHLCTECENLSINRIAADDDPQTLFDVYEDSFRVDTSMRVRLVADDIRILDTTDRDTVRVNLFGQEAEPAEMHFQSSLVKPE